MMNEIIMVLMMKMDSEGRGGQVEWACLSGKKGEGEAEKWGWVSSGFWETEERERNKGEMLGLRMNTGPLTKRVKVGVFMVRVLKPKEISVRVPKILGQMDGEPYPNQKLSHTRFRLPNNFDLGFWLPNIL